MITICSLGSSACTRCCCGCGRRAIAVIKRALLVITICITVSVSSPRCRAPGRALVYGGGGCCCGCGCCRCCSGSLSSSSSSTRTGRDISSSVWAISTIPTAGLDVTNLITIIVTFPERRTSGRTLGRSGSCGCCSSRGYSCRCYSLNLCMCGSSAIASIKTSRTLSSELRIVYTSWVVANAISNPGSWAGATYYV